MLKSWQCKEPAHQQERYRPHKMFRVMYKSCHARFILQCMEIYAFSSNRNNSGTVYPKKYAHGFCFAVLCCGYTLTDFPISIRLTSLALWQSNDCPSASKATLMNMDKYFMWIHYERLHNHNKAKHNKTVCIFLGIYCSWNLPLWKTGLLNLVNTMAADILAMQGARVSAAIVLIQFSWNIQASTTEGLLLLFFFSQMAITEWPCDVITPRYGWSWAWSLLMSYGKVPTGVTWYCVLKYQGTVLGNCYNIKTVSRNMNPFKKIRWPWYHLIFIMGIPPLLRHNLYTAKHPWSYAIGQLSLF